MSSRLKLYISAALLVVLGVSLAAYKAKRLSVPFWKGQQVHDWQIEAKVSFFATGRKVDVRLALPAVKDPTQIGGLRSTAYEYFVEGDQGRSTAVWQANRREDAQSLYFWTRIAENDVSSLEPVAGPAVLMEAEVPSGAAGQAADALVKRATSLASEPDSLFVALVSQAFMEDLPQEMALLKRHYDRQYQELGSVMMGIDLLRMAGVPARLAYGVKLREDIGVQPPVPLIEYHDGIYWKVRDPRAASNLIDKHALFVWHRGGGPLLEVTGGDNSKVSFTVIKEPVPRSRLTDLKDSPFWISTIMGLPMAERSVFRYLVLIPLGAFVVVLLRNVVGVPTLGTFMPVLIALALLEIDPVWRGLLMFIVLIAVGLWFRFLLSRLNLLVVPRVAACVVIVTLLMILMSVISYSLGVGGAVQITLFPMIILAWTIERMSLIWEEEGSHSALIQVGGSLFVSCVAYSCMKIGQIQYWAFYFPELLLVLLAAILMIGRYTGYRISELFRFKNFQPPG
ncbi:MAG TPA: UUP1 family membrane protein [Luteolibacter sp.]|nr:UUP1 family membrane protein [Luteolibacter sp.]